MPRKTANGTFEFSAFKGLRNTVTDERFEPGDLSVARNVDVDDSERVARRSGHSAPADAGAFRSLWSDGSVALAVRNDTTLVQIFPDLTYAALRAGLSPSREMSYAALGRRVYYSNGVDTGVFETNRSRTWGLAPPAAQPTAEAVGGTLRAGRYQYAVTYLRADGQESGTLRAGFIDLPATGGIRFTGIPVPTDPDVAGKVLYLSDWSGGGMLHRAAVLLASETSVDVMDEPRALVPLRTQHMRPAPAGQLVDVFNGWGLVASGDTLYPSEAFGPELFDLRKGIRMAEPITLLAALGSGVYVGTENQVVWLGGASPDKWVYVSKLAYGAPMGAAAKCSKDMVLEGGGDGTVVVFATSQGLCIGDEGGSIRNLTQPRYSYPSQPLGAALVRRHRGMVQAVVTLKGAEAAANVAS